MNQTLIKSDLELTEIIEGKEIMSLSPFGYHQLILKRLFIYIEKHLEKIDTGEIFFSPLDVIFEEGINRLQPDLIYIQKENLGIFQDWIRGTPDMLTEIVSEGTVTRDTIEKKRIYEKYGVSEFWLVFPENKCIEIFELKDGQYILFSSSDTNGIAKSKIIEGLTIHTKNIFF